MNWQVTITLSGNSPLLHPSFQPNIALPAFHGAAISLGGPSAAVQTLFVVPHAGGDIGGAEGSAGGQEHVSAYSLMVVSTLSLFALSMALFHIEEKRDQQRAGEQRAEEHQVAQRRPTQLAATGQPQSPAPRGKIEAHAIVPATTSYATLPLHQRTGVFEERVASGAISGNTAPATAIPVVAQPADRSADRQSSLARKRELIAAARQVDQRIHELVEGLKPKAEKKQVRFSDELSVRTFSANEAPASVSGAQDREKTTVKSA